MTSIFFVQCIIKQLLDSVYVISTIIKVSVRVINLNLGLGLITPTSTLIILGVTKTSSNNCLLLFIELTTDPYFSINSAKFSRFSGCKFSRHFKRALNQFTRLYQRNGKRNQDGVPTCDNTNDHNKRNKRHRLGILTSQRLHVLRSLFSFFHIPVVILS